MIFIKRTVVRFIFMSTLMFSSQAFARFQDFLLDPLSKCSIETHRFSVDKNIDFEYSTYTKRNTSKNKALVILPPTGGKNIIDKGYASMFCKAGYKVYILEDWTGLNTYEIDLKKHQRYQTAFQKVISAMLKKVKENKIGVLGASAGAINFSVTLGIPDVVKKVDAFMGIVSGSPLCKVIANAGEKDLVKVRAERMEKLGIKSLQDYEDKICENLHWDVAASKPEHLKLGLILSLEDKTVLTRFQEDQVLRMPPDFILRLKKNHKGVVISSYLGHRKKIKDFFDNALK